MPAPPVPYVTGSGSDTDPVAVVTRFVDEVVNGGDLSLLPELWHEDLRWHGGSLGEVEGLPAYIRMLGAARDGVFTHMRLTVHDTVAAGDTVVLRFTNSGVRTGELLGVPATGRATEWLGIGIYRVREGRIAEAWFGEDTLAMLLPPGAALPL